MNIGIDDIKEITSIFRPANPYEKRFCTNDCIRWCETIKGLAPSFEQANLLLRQLYHGPIAGDNSLNLDWYFENKNHLGEISVTAKATTASGASATKFKNL